MAIKSITRISTSADGMQGNGASLRPVFSPDGSKLAFWSSASNLVPGDTDDPDYFIKDLGTGAIERFSEGSSLAFSPDGDQIAFESYASNLVVGDTNNDADVFVKDLGSGEIERISTTADGRQGNGGSFSPVFSPDGDQIAFASSASNLVPNDTNQTDDVFVKDLDTGVIALVSSDANGNQANNNSYFVVFSPDGTKVAFTTLASNLVPSDTKAC